MQCLHLIRTSHCLKGYNLEGFPAPPQALERTERVRRVYRFSNSWTVSLLTILLQALGPVWYVETSATISLSNFQASQTLHCLEGNRSELVMPTALGKPLSNIRACQTCQILWAILETPLLTFRKDSIHVGLTLIQNVVLFERLLVLRWNIFPDLPKCSRELKGFAGFIGFSNLSTVSLTTRFLQLTV